MKTGIIFDLDGTLLDTLEDLCDAVNAVLIRYGYPTRTLQEVRRFVGNGAARLIEQAVPQGSDPEPVLAEFQAYYRSHCRIKTGVYGGIPELLAELGKYYPLAIVSNKPDAAVKALCTELFPGIFALGETAWLPRKPAADMVRCAMAAIGVERCIYVGDSEVDVATAQNAGVPCISILWGFRDRAELAAAGATYFCESPEAVVKLIPQLL